MKTLSRRTLLRGAGVALALPWLERMSPLARAMSTVGEIPKRAVFTFWGLGLNGRDYTPSAPGPDYPMTPILKPLEAHRKDFTVITGLQLRHSGGHGGDRTFLTGDCTHKSGAPLHISVDQMLADHLGNVTRFPSLVLGIERGTGFGSAQDNTLSWTRNGTPIPSENRPDVIFDRLFRQETAEQRAAREREAALEGSVLDAVRDSAKGLERQVGTADRRKLDEYFASIRDIEKRMQTERAWLHKEKPKVEHGPVPSIEPKQTAEFDYRSYQRLMYDLLALALQTDSTRVVSYMARKDLSDGTGTYRHLGNPHGYHTLTHHGEDPERLAWLTKVDIWHMEDWAYFLAKLKSIKEGEGTLLDNTMVMMGSGISDGNRHNHDDLPILLAGRGGGLITPGRHVKYDRNTPLCNLYVSMLNGMGVKTDRFGDSTAPMGQLTA